MAVNLANWQLHGDSEQMQADKALIDGLSTPPHGLGGFLVRSFLFQDSHKQTPTDPDFRDRLRSALLRAGHPFKVVVRLSLALIRVRACRVPEGRAPDAQTTFTRTAPLGRSRDSTCRLLRRPQRGSFASAPPAGRSRPRGCRN
jgi:hypothetical protein